MLTIFLKMWKITVKDVVNVQDVEEINGIKKKVTSV